ncbi:hypothetical protein BaRGS_00004474 [Batillaria attramentaria]|uniref:Uncharacterized protein n=1 Tax=Batillaria attramentaria TaxID=370345 RepID=A0ABD0LX04_9CAEN
MSIGGQKPAAVFSYLCAGHHLGGGVRGRTARDPIIEQIDLPVKRELQARGGKRLMNGDTKLAIATGQRHQGLRAANMAAGSSMWAGNETSAKNEVRVE